MQSEQLHSLRSSVALLITAWQLALQQVEEECLAKDAAWQRKDLLVSFVFPSGERLPWPAAKRSLEQEIESLLDATLGAAGEASAPPGAAAIGINCTKPHFLAPLVAALTTALARRTLAARPHLFVSDAVLVLRRDQALTHRCRSSTQTADRSTTASTRRGAQGRACQSSTPRQKAGQRRCWPRRAPPSRRQHGAACGSAAAARTATRRSQN